MLNSKKSVHKWLKSILLSTMFVLLASCATTYIPTDSTVGDMSAEQARKVLATELKIGENRMIRSKDFYIITDVRVNVSRLIVTGNEGEKDVFIYSELPQISVSGDIGSLYDKVMLSGQWTFLVQYPASHKVTKALYVLKQNAIRQKKASDEFDANFAASLTAYRNKATSNAALPEEANKYKVQAEGAVRDKQFDDAADFYAAALEIAPWWPVGHFNRALVLGEAGDYELAKREMTYYLQLVPDAPNARAAQDKIYEWARLESK